MSAHLGIEYRQWEFVMKLTNLFKVWLGCDQKTRFNRQKDAVNVFQRWLLSVQEEEFQRDCQTPLFPVFDDNHFINKTLIKDIHRKDFVSSLDNSHEVVKKLLMTISDWRTECYLNVDPLPPEVFTTADIDNKTRLSIGNFNSPPNKRITFLLQKYDIRDIAAMILRYESLGNGSYQWGDPLKVHRTIYTEFGARYEGFASPLNSRFLEMSGARFCSLFPDTDSVFGSLGSFFKIDLSSHPGGWTVNPPFIEHVLKNVAQKVISALERGAQSYFFLSYPYWDDSEGWIMLENSKFKVTRSDFLPKQFSVQDAYGKLLKPINKLSIFILGVLPDGCPPPSKLYEAVSS